MDERLGRKIGEGGCSEVFEWTGSDKIIKIAKPNTDYNAMRREYDNHCIAWDNGLPVAEPFEFLSVDGRPAIVFERIIGETIMQRFLNQVRDQMAYSAMTINDSDIRLTARALSEIHAKTIAGSLPSQKDSMKWSINSAGYLTPSEKSQITSILDDLPSKAILCHGDPNPGNIFVRADGSFAVIDWMNASIGNPEADLAEFIIMIKYAILPAFLPSGVIDYFDTIRESIIQVFMDEYEMQTGLSMKEVEPWLLPATARKLSADGITEDEKQLLIEEIRLGLSRLAEYH